MHSFIIHQFSMGKVIYPHDLQKFLYNDSAQLFVSIPDALK